MDHNVAGTRTVESAILPVVHNNQVAVLRIPPDVSILDANKYEYYCRDDRARLRWRIAKHPESKAVWVLRPCSGRLLMLKGSVYYGYTVP